MLAQGASRSLPPKARSRSLWQQASGLVAADHLVEQAEIRAATRQQLGTCDSRVDRLGPGPGLFGLADSGLRHGLCQPVDVDLGESLHLLHVMEMKPAFAQATTGRREDELYKMAKTMLSLPDTSIGDFIEAEQAAERIRDGYAEYFSQYDALITHVLPIPAHKHGVETFVIDGQTVDATYLQGATVPLNVAGLPGLSMRFGTSSEGLPINVQVVGAWHDEATVLQVATLLEGVSQVEGLHPALGRP